MPVMKAIIAGVMRGAVRRQVRFDIGEIVRFHPSVFPQIAQSAFALHSPNPQFGNERLKASPLLLFWVVEQMEDIGAYL
jgi:hypothetical protein